MAHYMVGPEQEGVLNLGNVGKYLPSDKASHSGKHEISAAWL